MYVQIDSCTFGFCTKHVQIILLENCINYVQKSNPLVDVEKESVNSRENNNPETKKRLSDQLRAERESFKAIFDRRRLRIEDE